jgi:hypothetical protein
MLSNKRKRVFVVEIEKKLVIRKTSESHLVICADCRGESDFISLRQAASIFDTDEGRLLNFVNENHGHYKTGRQGEIFLCLNSFIEAINKKTDNSNIRLLGEKK